MNPAELLTAVQLLLDRQAIRDCIHEYCRGMDRLDVEAVTSAYHEDALDDHGVFVGSPLALAEWANDVHERMSHATQHMITTHTCEITGDVAHAESYWMSAHMNKEGAQLSIGGGRYLDRLERRDGRWAIAARKCIRDWWGTPGEKLRTPEYVAARNSAGPPTRDRSDPSYERPLTIAPARAALAGSAGLTK